MFRFPRLAEGEGNQLDLMAREVFFKEVGISQIAHPGKDGLNSREARAGRDFDHVSEPIRIGAPSRS